MNKFFESKKGISIIETLIVVTVFAMLATVASQSIALSLRGARKSDSLSNVREEVDYSISVLDRRVTNAKEVISTCDGSSTKSITIRKSDDTLEDLQCYFNNPGYKIRAGLDDITSPDVFISECDFICTQPNSSVPPSIHLSLTAENDNATTAEKSSISIESTMRLRVY